MFNNRNITAGHPEETQRMLLIKGCSCGLFYYLYFELPDILISPLVEDGAKKYSPSFSRHTDVADAFFGVWLWLDQREKTYVFGIDSLEKS
ncbi:unnamed protein product, partial [marine sediment metagenome]